MKAMRKLLSALLLAGCVTASAQEPAAKTEYVFNPHWYIQVQGGAQYTLGELSFSDLISPNFQLSGGYNFNRVVGARLSVNAYQSKAGIETGGVEYDWKWYYVAPNIDATFNLSNLICGFNPERKLDFGVFIGIGLNIGFSNDDANDVKNSIPEAYNESALSYLWDGTKVRFQGRAGVNLDYNISSKVSIGLEVQATTLNDHYNSKKAGNADWYFNGLIGVKVALGDTYSTKTITPPQQPAPVERVVEKVVEKPVEVVREVVREPLRRDVFFAINSTTISDSEMTKVKEVADYLKANSNAKVELFGVADRGTGNKTINERLASQRAESVKTALINNYGIDASRISVDSKGDSVQPFEENNKNRVTICIAK